MSSNLQSLQVNTAISTVAAGEDWICAITYTASGAPQSLAGITFTLTLTPLGSSASAITITPGVSGAGSNVLSWTYAASASPALSGDYRLSLIGVDNSTGAKRQLFGQASSLAVGQPNNLVLSPVVANSNGAAALAFASSIVAVLAMLSLYLPLTGGAVTGQFSDLSMVDLGVTCDGATDIAAAINAAITPGKVNRLPSGDCVVKATIYVPSNTTLAGAGAGATILDGSKGAPGMGPVVSMGKIATSTAVNNAAVIDMTVKGNGGATWLAAAMNASQTTMQVASAATWPTSGNFVVTILGDGSNTAENVLVTGGQGSANWTVTRGYNGTTASAHGGAASEASAALVLSPRLDDGIYIYNGGLNDKALRVEVTNTGDNGVEVDGVASEVAYSYIHGNYTNGVYSIGTPATPNSRINVHENIVAYNSLAATTSPLSASLSSWDGIDFDQYVDDSRVVGNTVLGNDVIMFDALAAGTSRNYNNLVANNTDMFSAANCFDVSGPVDSASFVANKCFSPVGNALVIHGPAKNTLFNFNTSINSTGECILLYKIAAGQTNAGAPDQTTMTNNVCQNSDSGAVGSAIQAQDGATNTTIIGNQVNGTNGGVYAIDTVGAATSTYLLGNAPLTSGTTGLINLSGSQAIGPQTGAGAGSLGGGLPTSLNTLGAYAIAWGQNATASGGNSCAFGYTVTADGPLSCAIGGNSTTKGRYGAIVHASGDFAANGDAQAGDIVLRGQGTCAGGTVTVRGTAYGSNPNSSDLINLQANNYLQTSHQMIIKDDTASHYVGYTLTGQGIYRPSSGSTVLDATNAPSWVKGSADGATASGWPAPTIAADTGNNGVNVSWTNASCVNGDVYSLVDHVTTVEH